MFICALDVSLMFVDTKITGLEIYLQFRKRMMI